MSLPVTWPPPPASYSLVGSEMYSRRQFSAFSSHFQVTSGQMTSFPCHFRSPEVTWRQFMSRDCFLLWATALYEVKCTVYASFWPSTATSRWLPFKWRHFRVTSGHLSSRDVISCHVTAFSCGLQPCKEWNVQYTSVFGLLQPLPGDFRSNDLTSGSLPVIWDHVTSFPVTWPPPPASYSFVRVKCTLYACFWPSTATSRWLPFKWRHFRVTFGHLRSRDVISCHVTAFLCVLLPCRKWNVQYTPFFVLLQPLPGDFRSNDVTSESLPVTWAHVTSFSVRGLPPPARYSLVGSEIYSIRQFTAF